MTDNEYVLNSNIFHETTQLCESSETTQPYFFKKKYCKMKEIVVSSSFLKSNKNQ